MKPIQKILLILFLLVSTAGLISRNYTNRQQQSMAQLPGLQKQIADLETKLEAVTNEQQKTATALQELQNRQVVKQKSQDELLTAAVAKVSPVVVSVVISKDVPKLEVVYQNPFGNDPFFKDFNIRIPVYQQKGTVHQKVGAGTGFLITTDGYLLTNRHVVLDTQADYTVLMADGTQKSAQVIYRDPDNDLAVVKIEGGGYGFSTLGNSDTLKLGQTVAAIGNALSEYNNSVSVGIISGLDRTIEASGGGQNEKLTHVIQTDAAINPGNSGGPLLDLNGKVVGINVATVVGSNSISFAIPVNLAKGIIKTALGR